MLDLLKLDKHQMQYKNWCVTLELDVLKEIVLGCFTPSSLGSQHLGILMTSFHQPYILLEAT